MNVMITGAAGFIGGFLTSHALDAGSSVLGFDIQEPAEPCKRSAFEVCDIRDQDRVARLVAAFRPDYVFHLAAQSFPTVSMHQPRETMDINANGTINLFECIRS